MKTRSDPTLLAEVREYGKFDTNACFQCGGCTLICDLSKNSANFPRKMVRFVLYGLRDLLHTSLEPWICHDCGDCSIICPRETEPRESMVTLRRYLSSIYDWTGLSSRIGKSKIWHLGSLSVVGALVLLLVLLYHFFVVKIQLSDFTSTSMGMEHMFGMITYFTLGVIFVPLFFLLSHAFRMFMITMNQGNGEKIPFHIYLTEAKTYLMHSVTHKKLAECPEKYRWPRHWMLALGSTLMLVILVFFLRWFQTDSIYPIYHPQRWLGYLITILLIYGAANILIGRIKKQREIYKFSGFSDFVFPVLMVLTATSGIAVHVFRYLGLELLTHYTYALHLIIAVPMLVIEIPFGRWGHMIYRPLAIYFQSVREKAERQQVSDEVMPERVG
jgi:ferredoxin